MSVWRKPFKYAIKVLAFSTIWLAVGAFFILSGMAVLPAAMGSPASAPTFFVGLVVFALGYVSIYVGLLTALFRYLPEAVAEEIKRVK